MRTNCIDCLDRTNIAQFAYGLVALGHQLQALGFIEDPHIDLDNSLATEVMKAYESMGDTIAFQYGGSAAHNKVTFLPFKDWFLYFWMPNVSMLVYANVGLYRLWNVICYQKSNAIF